MAKFEITVGEDRVITHRRAQSIFVDAGKPFEIEFRVVEYDVDGKMYYCVEYLDDSYTTYSIPALIAALQKAHEIAREWAAESEGAS